MRKVFAILTVLVLTSLPALAQQELKRGPITTAGADCSTATACLILEERQLQGVEQIAIYVNVGTSGTFNFEAENEGGVWFAVENTAGNTSVTADGQVYVVNQGFRRFRVRASAISGAANVTLTRGYPAPGDVTANISGADGAIQDGANASIEATVVDLTNSNPLAVSIVDANGTQVTSFGGGTQYTEADTDSSITGTALMFEGGSNTLIAATGDATNGLDVDVTRVSGTVTVSATNLDVQIGGSDTVNVTSTDLDVQSGGVDIASEATLAGVLTSANFAAAFGTAGSADSQVMSVQGIASGTALTVSATNLDVQSGGADLLTQTTGALILTSSDFAAAFGTAGSADSQVLSVQGVASMTALQVANGGTFATQAAQSGTWDIGTVTAVTAISNALPAGDNDIGNVDLEYAGTAAATGNGTASGSLRVSLASDSTGKLSIWDGTETLSVLDTGSNDSIAVAIVDASGNQVTSFGGGTQYTQDAALTVGSTIGTMAFGRASAAAPTDVSADNDAVLPWYLRSGAVVVQNSFSGTLASVGVGASGSGTARTAALIHDGSETVQVTATSGGALQVECVGGTCSSTGSTPYDHGEAITLSTANGLATGGRVSAAAPSTTGVVDDDYVVQWMRNTGEQVIGGAGTAGSASANVVTVQGIASMTALTVSASNLDVQIGGSDSLTIGTMPADATELPAAAALADNTANPTIPAVAAYMMAFDGSTWDRAQLATDMTVGSTFGTTGPGTLRIYSDFDGSALPTATNVDTEGEAVPAAASIKGVQYVMVVNEDGSLERGTSTTPLVVSDGSGSLNVIVDSGAITVSATNLDVQSGGGDLVLDATVTTIFGSDAIFGTAGTADTDVLTVQGISSMTPFLVNPGTAAQWGVYVEDAAETAGANLNMAGAVRRNVAASSSATDGENVTINADALGLLWTRALDPCSGVAKNYFVVNISTATTTEIANAVASEFWYICSVNLVAAGAQTISIAEDDTDGCGSLTAGLAGGATAATGWSFAANGGITLGNGGSTVLKSATANRYLCVITGQAQQISGTISYVSAP